MEYPNRAIVSMLVHLPVWKKHLTCDVARVKDFLYLLGTHKISLFFWARTIGR
jgi:hypothetical protein